MDKLKKTQKEMNGLEENKPEVNEGLIKEIKEKIFEKDFEAYFCKLDIDKEVIWDIWLKGFYKGEVFAKNQIMQTSNNIFKNFMGAFYK